MAASVRPAAVRGIAVLLFLLLVLAGRSLATDNSSTPAPDLRISIHNGFVDEKTCASCHGDQAAAFAKSHHAKAMALADDSTVRGNFNNVRFDHDGVVTNFSRRNGRFFVRTEGPDGKQGEFEVKYTFAYEPLQQYLIDLGGGRLQALDIAWDTDKQEWFWLGEGTPAKPSSTYHWTGPFYRWNRTCIDCHSTDPQANFQPETNDYRSTYVATSIGCQSCHGGGAKHVEWAEARSKGASMSIGPDLGLSQVDANACFGCHSRRIKLSDGYAAGKPFLDYFSPALLRPDLYFPDGQILDEVFEYGSFQQSKMARAGVTCLDCHRQHEATLKANGNALCTQCHTETAPERFAKNDPSGVFDTPAHTHHPAGSNGAQCANCHMPQRTYMKVDPRRDHSFVIPRPDLSTVYGTPNACTTCHEGKTNAWAAENMDKWYGTAWRVRPTIAHTFVAAARSDPASIGALRKLVSDREEAGIVRGSAIAQMSRIGGADVVTDIKAAAGDSDPLVRLGAAEAAGNLPHGLRLDAIGKLLGDETRAVRVAAATALGSTPSSDLLGDQRKSFDAAVEDLRAYVEANADVAEAQNNYGTFLFGQRRAGEAEKAFRQAIVLDPALAGPHINLAELYRAMGQNEKSERAYAEAIAISPDHADLRYGHALSLVREKAMPEAIRELDEAIRLDPGNARYKTTLAIALDSIGRTQEAFDLLGRAVASGELDANLLGTAVHHGLKLRRFPETLKYAEALARLRPDDPQISELVRQLREVTGTK
ncbi:doubled CXXCH domain-containing protein [Rhizobium mongolense subsp. loessense]|uniref:Doubled CXXCH domain-containing protein n=1 Tax=Rhizobium mongolense subsp. loessense TaxID=158890 RepID=A0A1G4U7P8_9HYPH|nr:tetratricopeptide repeat protein [Rhizobium mongolense]SCW89668.1 doubled CXXCH domain-containing protein [Rhizobium mongolense subsp. loessense]